MKYTLTEEQVRMLRQANDQVARLSTILSEIMSDLSKQEEEEYN